MKVTQPSTTPEIDSSGETQPKRKKRGGKRPGAGRKLGSKDVLPHGTVAALNAAHVAQRRLGKNDADPEALKALEKVYERVGAVLEGKVWFQDAGHVLKASAMVADAVAGPLAQKHEVGGTGGGPLEVVIRDLAKEEP